MLQKILLISYNRLWIYGLIIIAAYGLARWLLAAFSAPLWVW